MNHREIEALITRYPIYQYAFVSQMTLSLQIKCGQSARRNVPVREVLVLSSGGGDSG